MSPKFETGTTHFLDRMGLTRRLEENIEEFLDDYGFQIMPYGHPVVIGNAGIGARLRGVEAKSSLPATMVKFTPDYLVFREGIPDSLFFMDTKASITPVFFGTQVERIKRNYGKDSRLTSADIGDIEREAWLSYNKFFPANKVAIFIAVPYHPRILLGEWVSNIKCMWCLKKSDEDGPTPWDCNKCPVFKSSGGFGVMVNHLAGGSGTPHTNINFKSMRTLDKFLKDEFSVEVDPEDYEVIVDFIKKWPLNKPQGRVSWSQYNGLIDRLRPQCPWLKYRIRDELFDENPRTTRSNQLRF